MTTEPRKFSLEVRERAVRMPQEPAGEYPTRRAAVESIAAEIGYAARTPHDWTKEAEVDAGKRAGVPTEAAEEPKTSERENRALRRANEIVREASECFARAGLDPPTGAMIAVIDEHRHACGVEPIREVPPIAPSPGGGRHRTPRATAVPSTASETAPTRRERHLRLTAERGRMG